MQRQNNFGKCPPKYEPSLRKGLCRKIKSPRKSMPSPPQKTSLSNLPVEILTEIMLKTHPDDIIELCLTDTKIARVCSSTHFKKEYKKIWNNQKYVLLIMEMPEIAESLLAQMLICKPHEADKFEAFIDRHPEFIITWTVRQRTIYEYPMEDLSIERKTISLPLESYKILRHYTSTVNNDITAGILSNIEGGTDEEEIDRLTQEWFDIWDKGERLYFDKIYI